MTVPTLARRWILPAAVLLVAGGCSAAGGGVAEEPAPAGGHRDGARAAAAPLRAPQVPSRPGDADGAARGPTAPSGLPPRSEGPPRPARPAPPTTTATTTTTTTTTTVPVDWREPPRWGEADGPRRPGEWQVALTFDDGPDPSHTAAILEVLAEHDVPATFFVLGSSTRLWPELVEAAVEQGHAIGNHSWRHDNLRTLDDDALRADLDATTTAIEDATGVSPECYRAPYGTLDGRVERIAAGEGLEHVRWNIAPQDYLNPPPLQLAARTLEAVDALDGGPAVILLHDGGGHSRDATIYGLPFIIMGLEDLGYDVVRLC